MSNLTKSRHNGMQHLRALLQKEFIGRCKRNPSYSLRAFAKFLGIDQSLLSKFLRGQRSISKSTASSLCKKLGMDPTELNFTTNISNEFSQLQEDQFAVISDWYHFALLELFKTNNFQFDLKEIANRLGVNEEEVQAAMERLQRLSIIELAEGKIRLLSASNSWSNTQSTSYARRTLQKQLLERGLVAIDKVPYDLRDNGSLTVAINKKRLPEFKEKLKQIRQELGGIFQADTELDEVYQLTVAFFPLTNIKGAQNET